MDATEARLKLTDRQWYDDWCSALGAQTLGYGFVEGDLGPAASLPWIHEAVLARDFCSAMDTEDVRFFKTGSDAVSCAVRLARAFTGRYRVIVFDKCYHGTGDWFGPGLWTTKGIDMVSNTMVLPFGEPIETDMRLVAAIVVELAPKSVLVPEGGWLQHLREVCDASGALLISDEVILGFRHSLRGFARSAGVIPDLACYGKAMAQGTALSACTGRADVMGQLANDVHFSGTNNGEPGPLAIATETLRVYQSRDVCGELSNRGATLRDMLAAAGFETVGLNARFSVELGDDRMSATRSLWDRRVLFPGFCSMSLAHTDEQMHRLVEGLKAWKENA